MAVVGSRDFKPLSNVDRFVLSLTRKYPDAMLVSGGARGVDRQAERSARAYDLELISFRPYSFWSIADREEFSIETTTVGDHAQSIVVEAHRRINPPCFTSYAACAKHRNGWIVDACDHLVAFWDGRSAGTFDSIRRAWKAGKLAAVYPSEAAIVADLRLQLDATAVQDPFSKGNRRRSRADAKKT